MAEAPATNRAEQVDFAILLNITADDVVQERGWDEDCDTAISEAIEDRIGDSLLDEDTDEVVDVVLLWWRNSDGDLVDGLIDAMSLLSGKGVIWLLTPKAGMDEHVDPRDISEATQQAGLTQTATEKLGDFLGACLAQPGASKKS